MLFRRDENKQVQVERTEWHCSIDERYCNMEEVEVNKGVLC